MPKISRFYGIVIKMYFRAHEHSFPHIHVYYNGTSGRIRLSDASMIDGNLSKNTMSLVGEWILLHKKELLEMWESQKFRKLEGLK